MQGRRVAVTGIGLVTPLGCGTEQVFDRLIKGESGIRRITRFDIEGYDSQIAGEVRDFDPEPYVPRKEQRRLDLFSIYGLAAAAMAVEDAGLEVERIDRSRAGVLIGSGVGGLKSLQDQHQVLLSRGPQRVSPFVIPQIITNIISGHVAIRYGLTGPNFCVVSACATGAHSVGEAARIISHGEADLMIAGGTEAPVCEVGLAGFAAMKALSTRNDEPERASRPFDAERDGFVIAEGAAVLVLEEMEAARKRGARIYCELAGYGRNCDAYHITAPLESGEGAARSMRLALEDAGITPEEVDYINAHGTSTKLNDRGETLAIKRALGEEKARRVMISSTKSMTGHLLGGAGALEAAVCAMTILRGVVHPTVNYEYPDPECDLDYVPNEAREAKVRVCLSNSLGFGGHNATLCLRAI